MKHPRLTFIDLARSLAIVMMLEGHFTGATLSNDFRTSDFPLYNAWLFIHGITSPLFFTVSGIIFTYLLSADIRTSYWKNPRVKKGYKRVAELLFWGYFLQVNLLAIYKSFWYNQPLDTSWLGAFHVLQSIAVGIFLLLVLYGIFRLIKVIPLWVIYTLAGFAVFAVNGYLEHYIYIQRNLVKGGFIEQPYYIPIDAPAFIQNMLYGKFSEFSFIRYGGYTLLGGAIGTIIRHYNHKIISIRAAAVFIASGLGFFFLSFPVLQWIDELLYKQRWELLRIQVFNNPAFVGLGIILCLLGLLILVNRFINVKPNLFLKMGQNTLSIYIVHVIILYEGIFGLGIYPRLVNHNLPPIQTVLLSLGFILLFALFTFYIEKLKRFQRRMLVKGRKFVKTM